MNLKALRQIDGLSDKKAKTLGIDYLDLLGKGLIKKTIKSESKYLIPANAPRWAAKYKFTRKKHNIEEVKSDSVIFKLTDKGNKILKGRKKKDENEEIVEKEIIEIPESDIEE